MPALNFHHLRYFWAIAHEGSLTRAASRLNVSPSALSIQLHQLEERLGHTLFERGKRKQLRLTEAGRLVLDHADVIFRTGDELVSTLKGRGSSDRQTLRIGATATLSRNFQLEFLRPMIGRADIELLVRTGSINDLVTELRDHTIDLVLSNIPRRTMWEAAGTANSFTSSRLGWSGAASADASAFAFPRTCARLRWCFPVHAATSGSRSTC